MYSKPHYIILDGLRGVAALMVLLYHLFEAIAFAAGDPEQDMFHGFLAVDFFFVLSGFVMGYAYDEKWNEMSIGNFLKRRIIRLHPMVVLGVVLGLVAFIIQGCTNWNGDSVPCLTLIECFVLSLFLLPSIGTMDVRGNTELFPLNGPHWSLFFEYFGSILYAIALRKLSTKWLSFWTLLAFATLATFGFLGPYDSIAYGWSSDPVVFWGGFFRMIFAYPMGLLVARFFRRKEHRQFNGWMFVLCALMLCLLLAVPSIQLRVYFELFTVAVAFPLIVYCAALGNVNGRFSRLFVEMLGNISYPLYAIHYPLIYLYIWWINNDIHPFGSAIWSTPVAISLIAIVLAYVLFVVYDRPLRRELSKKLL